jgi:hypothetical protein
MIDEALAKYSPGLSVLKQQRLEWFVSDELPSLFAALLCKMFPLGRAANISWELFHVLVRNVILTRPGPDAWLDDTGVKSPAPNLDSSHSSAAVSQLRIWMTSIATLRSELDSGWSAR